MIARFAWSEPKNLQEAIAQLGDGALVKAGGIDVMDRLKEGLDSPKTLVNIRNLPDMSSISEDAGGLRLGPLVTLAELEDNRLILSKYTALAQAAGKAATPQIRNMATVGGNLVQRPRCWYFRSSDFPCRKKGGEVCYAQRGENQYHAIFGNEVCAIVHPSAAGVALQALGATLELTGKSGKREVPIERFWVTPEQDVTRENSLAAGELITAIRVPALPAGAKSAYIKLGEKESYDWPIAEVAVVIDPVAGPVRSARIVLGAAAPVPLRATAAEQALTGRPVTPESARAAAQAAVANATPLRDNVYKIPVLETVVRRTILAAAGVKEA